jgi:hypothetical protein
MLPSDHNVAALSPLTYAANLASYQEDEVAWKTARMSAARNVFFEYHALMYQQVAGHDDDEHMCSALVHMCGEVCIDFKYCELFFTTAWNYSPATSEI